MKTKIELIDCNELQPGGKNEGMTNNKFFSIERLATLGRDGTKFLCPVGTNQMKLSGNIGSPDFKYVEIKLLGCIAKDCLPDKDIINTSINFVVLKAAPNLAHGEEDVVSYIQDFSFFKWLDPTRS